MPNEIQPQFKQLGNEALDNYDHNARPRFQGNEGTPVEANISPEKLVNSLQQAASGNSPLHSEAKQTLSALAEEHNGWNISAGVHQGGLGGGGFAPDPNKHITLSTGHHVQLNDKNQIKRITGQGIENRRTDTTGHSATDQRRDDLKQQHGLTDQEALKTMRHMSGGMTENQAVKKVKDNRR